MRVYASVDLDAIRHNVLEVRKRVGEKTGIMAVIKADGYGHGACEIARALDGIADYYAVATIEEGVQLRRLGIETPIMILSYVFPEHYAEAIREDIELTVFDKESASELSYIAKIVGKTAKVHIALDTGMSRIGFDLSEASAGVVKEISQMENIEIVGMFTHFATADEKDKAFTCLQYERYEDFHKKLSALGVNIKLCHVSNSAAIMDMPSLKCDMVRSGIITYGLLPSSDVDKTVLDLKPAMSIYSSISFVKKLPKGSGISYGQTYVCPRDMTVATIPVGYADGYPRSLSNKGYVLINGKRAPILGRVCMDQFMADVSDIDGVKRGDKVTLMGCDGDERISAELIASWADTINYEIVCGISKRVPRTYKK